MSAKPIKFNPLPIPAEIAGQPILVDIRQLLSTNYSPTKNTKETLQELQESLGYHRFVQCGICGKSMKIFICFEGSARACKKIVNTHTHLDCGSTETCHPVVLAGAVQMATKKNSNIHTSTNEQVQNT